MSKADSNSDFELKCLQELLGPLLQRPFRPVLSNSYINKDDFLFNVILNDVTTGQAVYLVEKLRPVEQLATEFGFTVKELEKGLRASGRPTFHSLTWEDVARRSDVLWLVEQSSFRGRK